MLPQKEGMGAHGHRSDGRAGSSFNESAVQAVKTRCPFFQPRDAAGHPAAARIEHVFYLRIGHILRRP
jgi:hypothetical protein